MNNVYRKVRCHYAENHRICGSKITTVILDTGIFPHVDFGNRIKEFVDLVNGRISIYDDNSHGTHVAGILAGSGRASAGKFKGIAPEADIIMIKVLDHMGNGETTSVIKGFEWIKKNKDKYNIKVVNISVGTLPKAGDNEKSILVNGVDELWDLGINVIAAAGNAGPEPGTITTPGISKRIITVGASDDMQNDSTGKIRLNYSGRGPTEECICKPDVVAPGLHITSCNVINKRQSKYYSIKSGTSMSTPIVSGAVLLLCQSEPELTNQRIKLKIRETCDDLGMPRNKQGWGLLNIEKLLKNT